MRFRARLGVRRVSILAVLILCTVVAAAIGGSAMMHAGKPPGLSVQRAAAGDLLDAYAHLRAHSAVAKKTTIRLDRIRTINCARSSYAKAHTSFCPTVWKLFAPGPRTGPDLPSPKARRKVSADLPPANQIGRWAAPFNLPSLAIHQVMLPTGKVLMFAYPDSLHVNNYATAYLWDPATGTTKEVDPPINPATGQPYNIWCSGMTTLPDGRVVVAGGNLEYAATPTSVGWKGLNEILTFNPFTETWTVQPTMRHGRWYPTLTTLPDGRVIIFSGLDESGNNTVNTDLEVFTPSANMNGVGTVTLQPTASHSSAIYPHMFVLPTGKVLMTGPDAETALLDTTTWTWTDLPPLPTGRGWGSAVLMPSGPTGPQTLMMLGGVPDGQFSAVKTTVLLNLNNLGAGWTAGPPMNTARAHLNTVILPDNSLLTVGGGAGEDPVSGSLYVGPVYQSEILSPTTNTWSLADTQGVERTYHSTALLLPSGQVLSAGDDRPGHQFNTQGEIYSPPYLFKGPRPVIEFAPTAVNYGVPFRIAMDYPQNVTSVRMIRLSAVTHANDMTQRSIGLNMTTQADGLTLTSPANANIAIPGYYMLFALNAQGVPSVAKIIQISPTAPAAPPLPGGLQPPSASFSASPDTPKPSQTVTLTDTSTAPSGTIASRAWDLDNNGAFDNGTGATATVSYPVAGTYTVREQVTDSNGLQSVATGNVYVAADPAAGLQPPAGNLTTNPTFEANTNGWGAWQGVVDRVPLADAPNGGWVARVTQNSGNYYTLDDGPDTVPSTTAGATYTATAYVKAASPSAVGKPVRIVIRERTAAGGFVQETSSTAVTLTNAFQPVTVTGTAQTTGDVIDLYIQQDNAVAGDSFYVDLASLVPVTAGGGGGTTPVPTGNLTANPSMETNAAGWGAWQSTLARTAVADAPNGNFAMQVSQASGTFYTIDDTPDTVPSATAGTNYTGTAYVKAATASAVGKPVRIVVRERTAAGGLVAETTSAAVTLTNAFQPITVTRTAQTTGDVIDLYIQQDTAVAGNAFYADLISLVPAAGGGGGGGGTTPVPTGNLTANPSMETNAAGWGAWQSTLARTAVADAPNGNFAMQVSQASGTFYTIDDTPDTVPSATAGTNYTGTAYVKAATASAVGKPVRIVVRERTAAGALRGRDLLGGGHPDQRLPGHHRHGHRADDGRRHRPLHPAGHGGGGQRLLRRPDLARPGRRRWRGRRRHHPGADRQPDHQPEHRDQHDRLGSVAVDPGPHGRGRRPQRQLGHEGQPGHRDVLHPRRHARHRADRDGRREVHGHGLRQGRHRLGGGQAGADRGARAHGGRGLDRRDHLDGGHPDQHLPAHHGDPDGPDDGRRHRPLHPAGHGGGGQRLLRRPDLAGQDRLAAP